jgi:hypothetical protein
MMDALSSALSSPAIAPTEVIVRLLLAFALGVVIAWIYRQTRGGNEFTATFPGTLVLLAVLIAMVTQVIGDSVARAFSLVGALSIVRFRTVVRDTQDTAFVIFAVVVGMAVGARDPWVALIGLAIVGAAAFAMAPRSSKAAASLTPFVLEVRIAVGHDLNETIGSTLDEYVNAKRLVSIGTAKQGIALDASYSVRIRHDKSANDLVKALNRLDGVQSVQLVAREEADARP